MFKKVALFLLGTVGAQSFAQSQLNALQSLSRAMPLQTNLDLIYQVSMMEQNLMAGKMELQNLLDPMTTMAAINGGLEIADKTITVVERTAGLVGKAVEWADKATDKAADTKRITEVLDFVRKEQSTLVQYTGKLLTQSITLLSLNALEISKAVQDCYFLAKVVKSKSTDTKMYIEVQDALATGVLTTITSDQKEMWEMTLKNLVQTLDQSAKSCTEIRNKLEKITRDVTELKSLIEGMVATAQTRVNAEQKKLEEELAAAKKKADEHRGCFRNVGEALKTIFSAGISCAMLDQTLKKCEANTAQINRTKKDFDNNVVPLIQKLKGLNGVAEDLLKEALTKTKAVREFETVLKLKLDNFKGQMGSDLCMRLMPLRKKMIADLVELIASCDTVMKATERRENDFKNILISVNEEKSKVVGNLVNLAAANNQLFLI